MLEAWQAKEMWQREADGLFFRGEKIDAETYRLVDFDSGAVVGEIAKADLKQIKPNSGIRALLGTALVTFQLNDPDRAKRADALLSLERDTNADLLAPLRASIDAEPDPDLKARKQRLERLLTISYDLDSDTRIAAIEEMAGDLGIDVRGALNPLTATTLKVFAGAPPEDVNVARILKPGTEALPRETAYAMLSDADLAPPRVSLDAVRAALVENIADGRVGGVPVAELSDPDKRVAAYNALAEAGLVPPYLDRRRGDRRARRPQLRRGLRRARPRA